MNKCILSLHNSLIALAVFTVMPAMAADNNADIDAAIQSISRDHLKNLRKSAAKEERTYTPSNTANSNMAGAKRSPLNIGDCATPWSPWGKSLLVLGAMVATNVAPIVSSHDSRPTKTSHGAFLPYCSTN
jgi:hypothetical protein